MKLLLQPFEDVVPRHPAWLAEDLERAGIRARVAAPLPLPSEAFDARRGQYRAEPLLAAVRQQAAGGHVLGVTEQDLYAGGLNFVFGMAENPGRAALISLHRLEPGADEALLRARMLKEALHELGHTLGLDHCPDPRCVMHFSNSLADTDYKRAAFCHRCRPSLTGIS